MTIGDNKVMWIEDRETGCWLWQGLTYPDNYAKYVGHLAARRMWEEQIGVIPVGLEVSHRCHDLSDCRGGSDCVHRLCVRPDPAHVVLETRAENYRHIRERIIKRAQCKRHHGPEAWRTDSRGRNRCDVCRATSEYQSRFRKKVGGVVVFLEPIVLERAR